MTSHIRIPANQSAADTDQFASLSALWSNDPLPIPTKLDSFTKYITRQSLAKFLTKYELMKLILPVNGSIAECGVLHGAGTLAWAKLSSILEPANHTRKIVGFDTFSGFAGVSEADTLTGAYPNLQNGALAGSSIDSIQQAIRAYDINRPIAHIPKIELVPGDISASAPAYLSANPHLVLALLYLDCDLYAPTKAALECFLPRMPKGGIIVFDELNAAAFPGETQAVHEVLGLANLQIRRFTFDSYVSYAVIV